MGARIRRKGSCSGSLSKRTSKCAGMVLKRQRLRCYNAGMGFSAAFHIVPLYQSASRASTMSPIMYSDPQAQTTPSLPARSMAVRTPSATVGQGVAFAPRLSVM